MAFIADITENLIQGTKQTIAGGNPDICFLTYGNLLTKG